MNRSFFESIVLPVCGTQVLVHSFKANIHVAIKYSFRYVNHEFHTSVLNCSRLTSFEFLKYFENIEAILLVRAEHKTQCISCSTRAIRVEEVVK